MMNAIEIDGLSKHYGRRRGVENLRLNVEKGSLYGFLGPNGAGKTTTIRLLLGLLKPSSGSARICGLDIRKKNLKIREHVGYLPGDVRFYNHLSGYRMLKLIADLRGYECRSRAEELAKFLDLDLSIKIRTHSRGMKQKLGIIQAMMHDPEVLILDEPTNGLDPLVQKRVYDLLQEYAEDGGTVFFSSHIISEVERICHRVAIIREGRLVADDNVASLQAKSVQIQYVNLTLKTGSSLPKPLPAGLQIIMENKTHIQLKTLGSAEQLVKYLSTLPLEHVTIENPSLEDVFMQFYREEEQADGGRA
jgi:ABC-2 type transport system ATP-binding protein